jgi:hypothetical protein
MDNGIVLLSKSSYLMDVLASGMTGSGGGGGLDSAKAYFKSWSPAIVWAFFL